MECATLAVPLDWSDSGGESIELAVARIPATGERIGTLLTNPGGPGGSGVEFLAGEPLGAELAESFDIVSWDPRGVGGSTSLHCDDLTDELYALDPTPDDRSETRRTLEVASGVAADCATAAGDLLAHLNTEEVARDMEAIRLALGGELLNYIGFSYGTHIGQEYAELFGENMRAMVLDGVVDPAQGFEEFLMGQVVAFDAAFERQATRCDEAGAELCGVENLIRAYDRVLATAENPGGTHHPPTPSQVALAAVYTGYLPDGWMPLGDALGEALAGDGAALAQLAQSYVDLADYGPYAAVVCTDSRHPVGAEAYSQFLDRAAEASPRFGPSIAAEMRPCATWAAPPQDRAAALTAADAPPILVVGNTGDPATPLRNAEAVAESLTSGVLLVVESEGHTAYGTDACATRIIEDHLVSLTPVDPGMRC